MLEQRQRTLCLARAQHALARAVYDRELDASLHCSAECAAQVEAFLRQARRALAGGGQAVG